MQVFVSSTDPDPDSLKQPANPDRPLPGRIPSELRFRYESNAFNVLDDEEKDIPKGRMSLDQITKEISAAMTNGQNRKMEQ